MLQKQTQGREKSRHSGRVTSHKAGRSIDVRVLLISLLTCVVGGVMLYFWHARQATRGAQALLDRAEQLEQEANFSAAASQIYRYTKLQPDDTQALIHLAEVYDKDAKDARRAERAIDLYYQAIAVADTEKQRELRRRLITLLLRWRRYPEAETEARKLVFQPNSDIRIAPNNDFESSKLLALALLGRYQSGGIAAKDVPTTTHSLICELRHALNQKTDPELALDLALLLDSDDPRLVIVSPNGNSKRTSEKRGASQASESPAPMDRAARVAEAESLMNRLVRDHADRAEALLVRSRYQAEKTDRDLRSAEADLNEALRIAPSNVDVHLAVALLQREKAVALMRNNDIFSLQQVASDQALGNEDVRSDIPPTAPVVETIRQLLTSALDHFRFVRDNVADKTDKDSEMRQTAVLGHAQLLAMLGNTDEAIRVLKDELHAAGNEGPVRDLSIRWDLITLLLAQEDYPAAAAEIELLRPAVDALDTRPDRYRFVALRRSFALKQAKCAVGLKEFGKALPLLERVFAGQPTSVEERNEQYEANTLAGVCYQELGKQDLAAAAYARAAEFAWNNDARARALLHAATVWETIGAIDKAIADCRRALAVTPNELQRAKVLVRLTRNLLQKQQLLPIGSRDWRYFGERFAELKELATKITLPDQWQVALLQADYELIRSAEAGQVASGIDKAFSIAMRVEQEYADNPTLMEHLTSLYQRLGKPRAADRVLKRFQDLIHDSTSEAIAAARLQFQRKEYDAALRSLREARTDASHVDRKRIGKMQVQIALTSNQMDLANQLLTDLRKEYPHDMSFVQMQFQLATERDDVVTKRALEETVAAAAQKNDRRAATMRIRQLLKEATSADDPSLFEAIDMLSRMESSSPDWSIVHVLRGQVEEKRGNYAEACEAYQRALKLGDRRLVVYERLIVALYQLGEFQRAQDYLSQIDRCVPFSTELSTLAISVADRQGNMRLAIDIARRAVERRPEDPVARVWYGQSLLRADQMDKAKAVLSQALELAPANAITWNGMFEYYRQIGNKEKARETLDNMVKRVKLPKGQLEFILAQAYQALEDWDKADEAYRAAIKEMPSTTSIRMHYAAFCQERLQRGELAAGENAVAVLRGVLRDNPKNRDAKRRLASILASVGGESEWKEVEKLTQELLSDAGTSVVDQRLQAVLLFQRGGDENLEKARVVFQRLVGLPNGLPNDRLILARILESQGKVQEAKKQFALLARQKPRNRQTLFAYSEFLLRHAEYDTAKQQLAIVKNAFPEAFDWNVLYLEARLLDAEGKAEQIPVLIESAAEKELQSIPKNDVTRRAQLFGAVAELYSRFEIHADAERWNRRLVAVMPKQFAKLAICLAQQGKMDEAIEICVKEAEDGDFPPAFAALAAVLTSGTPSAADFARTEGILDAAKKRYANSPTILFALSSVRIVQNNMDEAIELLERVVELDPKNVVALNNLASIMAERPELRQKALDFIDRAIGITGPRPDYFDTKGSILLYNHEPGAAIELFKSAVDSGKDDPRFPFHLAAAYFSLGDSLQAAKYFREAMEANLEGQILTDTDRKLMADMQVLLEQP